jgi:hypothetical protein
MFRFLRSHFPELMLRRLKSKLSIDAEASFELLDDELKAAALMQRTWSKLLP